MKKASLAAIFLIIAALGMSAQAIERNFRILVLHSYSQDFSWTESINRGLHETLNHARYELSFEYLDAKRYTRDEHLQLMAELIQSKYRRVQFDLVLVSDNIAYELYRELRDDLFPDTPLLAIGLNSAVRERLENSAYIIENNDYQRTLELAMSQYPLARRLYIVLDQTPTGMLIRDEIGQFARTADLPPIEWIDSGPADEILRRIEAIPPDDILVYILYFSNAGSPVDNSALLQAVSARSPVPVYGFWSFALSDGAMGGSVYDGRSLGQRAGNLITEYLERGGRWDFYIDESITRYIIDYPTALRYGLTAGDFPRDTLFLRRPESFFSRHASVLLSSLGIILVLVAIIVLVQLNLRRQRAINRFNRTLMETQREILFNLGTVIERRSRETADHLKRITGISESIARKLRIKPQDMRALSFGAALHDVGKVGISDEILKKRESLDEAEMDIIRTHPEVGWEILSTSNNEIIRRAARIAREHHERWDGKGYPRGISGKNIDLLARIVTVADNIDALLTERSYKRAWSAEEVREYVWEQKGLAFDPDLADLALDNWDELYRIWMSGGVHD
jgi:HD-GYP domain-containing protein (c-di-GMP phosphodiesterase class II)